MATERGHAAARRRGRWVLVLLACVFILPVLSAWFLNVRHSGWLPFGTVNRGELIEPALPVAAHALEPLDGVAAGSGLLDGHWTMMLLIPGPCGEGCEEALYRMRQTRLALGRHMDRVHKLIVVQAQANRPDVAGLLRRDADLRVTGAPPDWGRHIPDGFDGASVYLVDPQGFLIMRYSPESARDGMLKDLKRLLRISKIG